VQKNLSRFAFTALASVACAIPGLAQPSSFGFGSDSAGCASLPGYQALKSALSQAVSTETSGLNNHMWGTIVDRSGVVCAVAFSGSGTGSQWLGSRVISAQKANTANDFSLDPSAASNGSGGPLALSTANLYSAVQPGGSLYGLQASNPVDPAVAYASSYLFYGTPQDAMVGNRIGGVNVFGGGLALYNSNHQLVGAIGVSGDTSCADHFIAWRTRSTLGLDHLGTVIPGPASLFASDPTHPDNIIFDITANPNGGTGNSTSGFGHPKCLNTGNQAGLPAVSK
jgi:Haem-degrading